MTGDRPRLGIDVFLGDPRRFTGGPRIALATNQAALTSGGVPTLEAVRTHPDLELAALFTFEHGLSGFGADATPTPDAVDARTGLPLLSLYGPRRRPDSADLRDLDAVVVDVQEVGVRAYTYAATVALLLEAAAETGTRVVICDRPSLLGPRVAGPPLDPAHRSFLAYLDVPFQHGLTLGELARWHAHGARCGDVDLVVAPAHGWRRDARPAARPFVPPSPGLPGTDAVALYPGLVLLEGTNLSEGRGTPLPFSLLCAPWLEAYALAERIAELRLPGLLARPLDVEPEAGPFAGRLCHGVQLHVTDPDRLAAFEATVRILTEVRAGYEAFAWTDAAELPWSRHPDAGRPWHEPSRGPLIDGLTGGSDVRDGVDGRRDVETLFAAWRSDARRFASAAEPALLYEPGPTAPSG